MFPWHVFLLIYIYFDVCLFNVTWKKEKSYFRTWKTQTFSCGISSPQLLQPNSSSKEGHNILGLFIHSYIHPKEMLYCHNYLPKVSASVRSLLIIYSSQRHFLLPQLSALSICFCKVFAYHIFIPRKCCIATIICPKYLLL